MRLGGPYLVLSRIPRTGRSPQPPRSKPLRGAQPHDSGAIVSQIPLKQARNENAIEPAILNRVLDRDSQPRPRPRLKSQPQGATKFARNLNNASLANVPFSKVQTFGTARVSRGKAAFRRVLGVATPTKGFQNGAQKLVRVLVAQNSATGVIVGSCETPL